MTLEARTLEALGLRNQPLYIKLAERLTERIRNEGWVKVDKPLPNEHTLAGEYGVSNGTVRKSLELLEERGVITRKQGRGTFVMDPRAAPFRITLGRMQAEELLRHLPGEINVTLSGFVDALTRYVHDEQPNGG